MGAQPYKDNSYRKSLSLYENRCVLRIWSHKSLLMIWTTSVYMKKSNKLCTNAREIKHEKQDLVVQSRLMFDSCNVKADGDVV